MNIPSSFILCCAVSRNKNRYSFSPWCWEFCCWGTYTVCSKRKL